MGLLENGLKSNIVSGLAIGIGAAVIAPLVIPIVAGVIKPFAKGVIKQSLLLYEKGAEKMAEAKEAVEDLVAEARSEAGMCGAAIHPEEEPTAAAADEALKIEPQTDLS